MADARCAGDATSRAPKAVMVEQSARGVADALAGGGGVGSRSEVDGEEAIELRQHRLLRRTWHDTVA